MEIDLSRFRDSFFQEAAELLEDLEAGLLRLERQPDDFDTLNAVFRAAHSIKGSAGMLEMVGILRFTHSLESLLDAMRAGEVKLDRPRLDLLFQAADTLRALVAFEQRGGVAPAGAETLAGNLTAGLSHASSQELSPAVPASSSASTEWEIRIQASPDCLARGLDPLKLLAQLDGLGRVVTCELDASLLPPLAELDPMRCHLGWRLRLETGADAGRIDELLDWFGFDSERRAAYPETERPRIEPLPPPGVEPPRPASGRAAEVSTSVRVAVEKIDQLVTLAGELAVAHSMASEVAGNFQPDRWPELEMALSEIGRQVWLLQQSVLSVRMLPASDLLRKLPRLVRELEGATGKGIDLELDGGDAEMDKSVAERLVDPLTHLVRNAADHGIEPPEERVRLGKPRRGLIRVRAMHESGDVVVEILDDGKGLDAARIRAKAIERGLLMPEAVLSDRALFQLIFEPGFSTAPAVTDLSGRGVGMDVVRRNVVDLGGAVTLSSRPGEGTLVRIRLPLTLAIVDGLLFSIAGGLYLMPMTAIVKSVEPGLVSAVPGMAGVILVDGEPTPLAAVADLLQLGGSPPDRPLAVIITKDGVRAALLVDEVVGRQQVMVRNLEDHYRKVPGLLGASILGDGRVALILDPNWMIAHTAGAGADR